MSDDQSKCSVDKSRRCFLTATTAIMGGLGLAATAIPFAQAWTPSERAKAAGAPVEANVAALKPGEMMTVEWRGKPVWILRRTKEMVAKLPEHDDELRDPKSLVDQQPDYARNEYRSIREEYLVLVGLCTHLGCVPGYRPVIGDLCLDWPGGFFCPCHGSKFDFAGRVFKDVPAPINLEVPPYMFVNDQTIMIGVNPEMKKSTTA